MENRANIDFDLIEYINKQLELVNDILGAGIFNSQTLKKIVSAYENLYKATNDIMYKKNIADIYYFYFKDKEKALQYYLEYSLVNCGDSSVFFVISSIYKTQNDNKNYKKYLNLAIATSQESIKSAVPNSNDVILGINIGVAAGLSMNENVKHGVDIYKNLMQYSPSPQNILSSYVNLELEKAKSLYDEKRWDEALIKYKSVFNNSKLEEADFINLITCLAELNEKDLAMEYLRRYEETSENKNRANYVVADLLYFKFNEIPEAIKRFERYISTTKDDALVYNTLGHLYSTYYNDKFLDVQLKYFKKAQELIPNSKIFNKNLALIYNKLGDFENSDKYYNLMLQLNSSNDDRCDYGCFLIQNGNFKKGFEYYTSRFFKETKPALYPPMLILDKKLTDYKQIKDSIILVQCEQGYGDTIMFSRYVKQLKSLAKKVIFMVQDSLVSLFESSDFGVDIYGISSDYAKLEYDYHVPLMNLPLILDAKPDSIPDSEGYLCVDDKKVKHFNYEFIEDTNNLKIGLAYSGLSSSEDMNRDVALSEFLPILKRKDLDIYILQHEDTNKQIGDLPSNIEVINVGKDFATFEDTAAAIKNMDLVITTDNVILNLAGALGVKTYGIFNRFAEFRWFDLNGDDVKWYKSVKPYQTKDFNIWEDIIEQANKDIKK